MATVASVEPLSTTTISLTTPRTDALTCAMRLCSFNVRM
jgi:hypothetical protein